MNESRYARDWRALYSDIRRDIYALTKACDFEPTWQQGEVLDIVQWESTQPVWKRKKRVTVKSGQGPGKSTVSVYVAGWRSLMGGVGTLTVVTAPTMTQLKDVFLGEARRQFQHAEPCLKKLIDIKSDRIVFAGKPNWAIRCRTATRPENFQGYHQKRMTFIVDEASGVDAGIIQQIQGTLTNDDSLLMLIGNPNTRSCKFYDTFNKQRHQYHTFTFNAEDSPIVDKGNIKRLEDEYGRDSDVFRVRVLGEFPEVDPDAVLNVDDLEACTVPKPYECINHNRTGRYPNQIGIDVARFGSDESTIYVRSGAAILAHKAFTKTDPSIVLAQAMELQKQFQWGDNECRYVLDADGMGQGVAHILHNNSKTVLEYHAGGPSYDPDFENVATHAWFQIRELSKQRLISMPNDNRLLQQLGSRKYEVKQKKGRSVSCIESKQKYKERMAKEGVDDAGSPDRADGFVMAFYEPEKAGVVRIGGR